MACSNKAQTRSCFVYSFLLLSIYRGQSLAPRPERQAALPRREKFLAFLGSSPTVDGVLEPGEYDDAFSFKSSTSWVAEFAPATNASDLSARGWIKHDDKALYFAFEVQDDLQYAVDTPRWLPAGNPNATELTRKGWPWFGDELEIIINAGGPPSSVPAAARGSGVVGNASQWQMVVNTGKSRLGGVGTGGLLEGEPRSSAQAWSFYQSWIESGAMTAATSRKESGQKGYVVEWRISFELMQIRPGQPYSASMADYTMSLNIALGDVDAQTQGDATFGLHHEQWPCGSKAGRTNLGELCEFVVCHGRCGVPSQKATQVDRVYV